jgi:hypothetical protein
MDFSRFWAFNTAEKTVTKVGIYALPPLGRSQKVTFFEILAKKQILRKIYRDSWVQISFIINIANYKFLLKYNIMRKWNRLKVNFYL